MGSPDSSEYRPGENNPQVADRWREALNLRRAGKTYEEIAESLGYASASGAYAAVMSALKATLREPSADVRSLEVDRLDRIMNGCWEAATNGDSRAIASVLSIMDRRARLLGLDAPVKTQVEEMSKGYFSGNSPDDLWTAPDSTGHTEPLSISGDQPIPS